jgi:hypothetical protein
MSTGGNATATTTPTTHPAVWTMSVAGVIAFIGVAWGDLSPMLPKSTTDVVQPIIQQVVANETNIQKLVDELQSLRTLIPVKPAVVTPVVAPVVAPVVSPDIQALQDQIKALKDLLDKQNQPPPPVVVPPPILPSAIKAVDSQGKPVSGTVDSGQQFFVQATVIGGTWTVIKSAELDVDAKVYTDEVSCVMRNQASITVVYSSGQPITTSSLIIKCNKAPQPPPGPTPVVTVDPIKPTISPPQPLGSDLRVMIVFESGQNHTREQLNVLNSTNLLAAMNAKCVKDSGLPSWRRWDKDLDASKDPSPAMRALWDKVLPIAKEDGLPAIAVACGSDVAVYPLPKTDSEAIALLACGGK